jgi:hypothetical protein
VPPFLLQYFDNGSWLIPGFWGMFSFLAVITFLVVIVVLAVQRQNSEMYAQAFLGSTTFKLLTCLVFVLVFVKKNHPEKYVFVADFMYLYLLNTAFEIYGLLRSLRNQNLR